jgi:hypothetical protein
VDGEEQLFLRLINDYRAKNGAPALSLDAALTRAATWMANDLAGSSAFGHTDSTGRSPWVRMPDCGVVHPGGENLAAGTNYSSAQTALSAWINSPSHRSVMLTAEFKVIGIARVYREGSTYGWYWVTDFGYGGAAAAAPAPPPPPGPAPAIAPAPRPGAAAAAAPAPARAPVAPETPAAPPPPASVALNAGLTLVDWAGGYRAPEEVFGPDASWIGMVYVFDQGTQTWLRWGPGLASNMQTLTELRTGVQYWVVSTRPVEVPMN